MSVLDGSLRLFRAELIKHGVENRLIGNYGIALLLPADVELIHPRAIPFDFSDLEQVILEFLTQVS